MITLKKITEEGEQFIAIGNTYKQMLDQLLDILNDNIEGVKYELLLELEEESEYSKTIKQIEEEPLDEE